MNYIKGILLEDWCHVQKNSEVELLEFERGLPNGALNWGPINNSETVHLEPGDFDYLKTIIKQK
jgi:hypothetical protein